MKANLQEAPGGLISYGEIDPMFFLAESLVAGHVRPEQQWLTTAEVFVLLKDYVRHLKQNYYSGIPEEAWNQRVGLFSAVTESALEGMLTPM